MWTACMSVLLVNLPTTPSHSKVWKELIEKITQNTQFYVTWTHMISTSHLCVNFGNMHNNYLIYPKMRPSFHSQLEKIVLRGSWEKIILFCLDLLIFRKHLYVICKSTKPSTPPAAWLPVARLYVLNNLRRGP